MVEMLPGTAPDEVRYPLEKFKQQQGKTRVFISLMYLLAACVSAWQLWRGHLPLLPLFFLTTAAYSQWRIRNRGRDAVATREGIFGPHLRHPILWRDVAYLQEPLRYDLMVEVKLNSGERKSTGFPPEYFARLHTLTNVPTKPQDPLR